MRARRGTVRSGRGAATRGIGMSVRFRRGADAPHGDHATERTVRLCTPSSSATVTHAPPAAREGAHRRTVLSEEHVARDRPWGSHATHHTRSVWPSSVACSEISTASAPARFDAGASGRGAADDGSEADPTPPDSPPPLPRPRNESIAPRRALWRALASERGGIHRRADSSRDEFQFDQLRTSKPCSTDRIWLGQPVFFKSNRRWVTFASPPAPLERAASDRARLARDSSAR